MKPTREEFRELRQARPGTVLIFEEDGRYFLLGFDALLAANTLDRPCVPIRLSDRTMRAVYLRADDLSRSISEIKRRHFGIKVEIIR